MKKFLALSLIGFMMMSCSISPENYQVEINDAVKFYLAACDLFVQYQDDEKADKFYDEMIEEFAETSETEGFKYLLQQKVAENNKYAKKTYVAYENNPILLSGFTPTEENVWQFEELNSAVHFTFTVTSTSEGDRWDISPDEKDIQCYLWKKFIGEEGIAQLMALGLDIDSVAEASVKELEIEETIAECIDNAYSGLADDKDVMTPDFCEELHKAFKYSSLDSWARNGYWKYADGTTHNYEIIEYEHKNAHSVLVQLELSTDRRVNSRDIILYMECIDGKWLINDICGLEWGQVSYSVWDFATMTVGENERNPDGSY